MAGKRGRMSEDTSKVPSWRWPEEERGEMKMTSKAKEEYRGPRIFLFHKKNIVVPGYS